MKIFLFILIVIVVAVGIFLIRKRSISESNFELAEHQNQTLEEKLKVLASAGLKLSEPFSVKELLTSWAREEYERPGYDLVLVGLGMTEEQVPWRNHSVNLWHFDTECVEGHGDYKQIVERMVEITQGSLSLENIQDYVDIEKEEAWFSFSFQGKEQRVDCKVEDDWVDSDIFSKFVDLLSVADSSKIYIYYDLGGQDCIIGCVAREELRKLNAHGIAFVPLT